MIPYNTMTAWYEYSSSIYSSTTVVSWYRTLYNPFVQKSCRALQQCYDCGLELYECNIELWY